MRSGDRLIDNVFYQPIVDADRSVVGFESLARITGVGNLNGFMEELDPSFLDRVLLDVIETVSKHVVSPVWGPTLNGRRLFLNCEKCNLANPELLDNLIAFFYYLKAFGVELVVEITERDLQSSRAYSAYLEGVRRLSLARVKIALDDFLLDESDRTELERGLCNIVKLEVDALPLDFKALHGKLTSDHLLKVADDLGQFARRYEVELLLERVEKTYCFKTLSSLPFHFFQGYQFAKPAPISHFTGKRRFGLEDEMSVDSVVHSLQDNGIQAVASAGDDQLIVVN